MDYATRYPDAVPLKDIQAEILMMLILTRSTQRAQTSADLEDPDFGLWTPGSEA